MSDDAVLFVARWLDRLVVEEDMHRELSCVDTARPTADACPAEFHVFDALSETGKKTLEEQFWAFFPEPPSPSQLPRLRPPVTGDG